MSPLRLLIARSTGRSASLCRKLQRTAGSAKPYSPAFGAKRAHTLVENRAIKFLRRDRGAGQLAKPGKDFFKLLPGLQFRGCAARRKRSGHHFSIASLPKSS